MKKVLGFQHKRDYIVVTRKIHLNAKEAKFFAKFR